MNSIRIPSPLLKSIEMGRCILFVGSGVSYEAGFPTSSELATMLAEDVEYPETFPHDLVDISQYYEAKLGRTALLNRLKETLQKPSQPSATHKLIVTLSSRFKSIITTNYDSLLEKAFTDVGYPIHVITKSEDLARVSGEMEIPTLLKIHGDLDADNIIITKDDYYSYLDKSFKSTLGAIFKAQLATGTFLFVGYSLRDYNFVSVFESVRKELGDYMPEGYAVMPSPDPVETSMWLKRGVHIIDATAKDFFEQLGLSLATSKQIKVYISHSLQDSSLAETIQSELESRGIMTFSATRDINIGDNILEKVNEGIVQSQAFILLLSPESVSSTAIMKELDIAQSLRRRFFPILLRDCEIPETIRNVKYLDFRDQKDFSSLMAKLVSSVERKDTKFIENIKEFDKSGEYKIRVDTGLRLLILFRQKYPFKTSSDSIDNLTSDDLFMENPPRIGDFFRWLEFRLKPIGHISVYSKAYRNASKQLGDFKALLRIVVDDSKTLAEKVDAPWQKIPGMGGDKHIAKKIIFCFNDNILPIFKTSDMEHFLYQLRDERKLPLEYEFRSLGEKYLFLTRALIDIKESFAETQSWDNSYFMWFLYKMYPPP